MIRFLQTPGPLKKILLGGLLLVICVMMVVTLVPWGSGGFLGDAFGAESAGIIAKVGPEQVTLEEVRKQANQMAKQQFPRGFPPQFMSIFMQRAADSLILQNVVLYQADRMGLSATDEELRAELHRIPDLFPGGKFIGQEQYADFVASRAQMTVPQFEQMVKRQITIRKLRSAIEGGVTVSNQELAEEFNRQNVKVKFDYAVLSIDDIMKGIKPSESELKAYYEQNKGAYENSIPEQRKARYIDVPTTKAQNSAKVTQEDLQNHYRAHQDEYRVPESVNVRHILIKTPPPGADGKVDQKAVDAARAKAEDLLKQIKGGANFADLAKKYSDDPGSKDRGGLYEGVIRGQMVGPFEQAAFNTPEGQVTGPVQTDFGFHVVKVDKKTAPHQKTLEEVRSQIEPIVAQQKLQSELDRLARTVEAQARTQGLEKAAAANGLQVITTEFFPQGAALPGIGNTPEFMTAVFGEKPMSPPRAVRTPNGYAVVQAIESKPASTPGFEQIRDKIAQEFRQRRAQELLGQRTQELSDRARAEHNLKAAAKAVGATIHTSDLVSPGQQVPQLGQLAGPAAQVFELKPGEISGPIPAGGNGVVIQLTQKQEPSADEFAKQRDQVREAVLQRKRGEVIELWAANLREQLEKDGKVKVNQKELARIGNPTGAE